MPRRRPFLTLALVGASIAIAGCSGAATQAALDPDGDGVASEPFKKSGEPTLDALLLRTDDLPDGWDAVYDDLESETNLDRLVLDCLMDEDLEPVAHVPGPNLVEGDARIIYTFADRWKDVATARRVQSLARRSVPECLDRLIGSTAEPMRVTPPIPGYVPVLHRSPDETSMALGVTCEQDECLWIQFAPALHDVPARELAAAIAKARARHASATQ